MVYEERGNITMNKKIAKLLALGMSIAMVFSLAACGDDTADEPSTEAPTTTEATTEAPAVPATGESESVLESESGEPASSEAPGAPTDTAGVINMFNAAVDKVGSISATYDRAVNKSGGNISLAGVPVAKFEANSDDTWNYDVLSANFDKSGAALDANKTKIYKLDSGSVASAKATDNGDTIALNISLKDASVELDESNTGATDGFGTGGYMYFINFEETNRIVKSVIGFPKYSYDTGEGGFGLVDSDGVNLVKATFNLSGGTIEATIDKASGKLTKASLSFSEDISGKAKYGIASATANIGGSGTIHYTFG